MVPQQALALTNSNLVLDATKQIAGRLSKEAVEERVFIEKAFALLLGMKPGDQEVAVSKRALQAWRQLSGGSDDQARAHLIWTLINHNDFVTLR